MSSTLDPDTIAAGRRRNAPNPPGHDVQSLGPSDSSDSGSDMAGSGAIDSDAINLDRGTDRVVGPEEAGLGGGLDQAEEAQIGITDDELQDAAGDDPRR